MSHTKTPERKPPRVYRSTLLIAAAAAVLPALANWPGQEVYHAEVELSEYRGPWVLTEYVEHGWPFAWLRRQSVWPEDGEPPSVWNVSDGMAEFELRGALGNLAAVAMIVLLAAIVMEWRRRRRSSIFQFRLTDLLGATTIVAAIAAYFVNVRSGYAEEQRLEQELNSTTRSAGYGCPTDRPEWSRGGPTWLRRRFGDDHFEIFDRTIYVTAQDHQFGTAVKLRHLKALSMCFGANPTQSQFDQLGRLRKLEVLTLENMCAKEEDSHRSPPLMAPAWPNLRILDLSGVSAFRGDGLHRLTDLESLSLRHTQVPNEALSALEDMPRLSRLDLSNTGVTDAGLMHIAKATQLETLILNDLPITDRGLEGLPSLQNLEELELCFTRISDEAIHHLKNLRSLRRLRLTHVSPEAMNELRTALPDCSVW